MTEAPETIDLTGFDHKDEFITEIQSKCKSYNAAIRTHSGESKIQVRDRLFRDLAQSVLQISDSDWTNRHRITLDESIMLGDVRRDHVVSLYLDTISTISSMYKQTLLTFYGNIDDDDNALRKEFFRLITDKLMQIGVFSKVSDESNAWDLNPDFRDYHLCTRPDQVRDRRTCFENVGKMFAKILFVEGDYVDIPFSNRLRQKILGYNPSDLADFLSLAKLDDRNWLFKNQMTNLTNDDPSSLDLRFVGHNGIGLVDYVTNGAGVNVVAENIYLYTLLDLKNNIETRRSEITQSFLNGFFTFIEPADFHEFGTNANELELLFRGVTDLKADDVQAVTAVEGGGRVVRWFWDIVK